VYNPAMLMIDTTGIAVNATEFALPPILEIVMITITAIIGIIGLSAAAEGYFKTKLNVLFRIVLGAGALMLIVPETLTDIIGLAIVLGIFINFLKSKKENTAAAAS